MILTTTFAELAESIGIEYDHSVEPVHIHDSAGLAALPINTRLLDSDRVVGMIWVRTHRGWVYGRHGFPLRHYEELKPLSCFWTSERLGEQHYGPFEVLNPEILGEFWPEWGSEDFKPRARVENLHAGKKASVLGLLPGARRWLGLPVEIVKWNAGETTALVRPLSHRPDNHRLAEFYWDRADLFLVGDAR